MNRDTYLTIEDTDVVEGKRPEQGSFLASKLYVPKEKVSQLEEVIRSVVQDGWIVNDNPSNVSPTQKKDYETPTCAQGYNRLLQEIKQRGIDLTFFLMYRHDETIAPLPLEGFDNYEEVGVFVVRRATQNGRPEYDTYFFRPAQYATIPARKLEADPVMEQLSSQIKPSE